jgi:hypothetical protein
MTEGKEVYLLDYGAGNVLSVENAVKHLGFTLHRIRSAQDFKRAKVTHRPICNILCSVLRGLTDDVCGGLLATYLSWSGILWSGYSASQGKGLL